ncbi:MAG: sigma-70 family RNA polymerase sigma factor [Candidatus Moranbacteria bacterium]|jgi:RNA polymerase sigma-70 factor (ECF subfamily)|nr:sigma-70 family RNA polymerase sigma factor [Candidatus Moranbacteria bacterium]MBP9801258.1 sigma-70 family RNA polymerase sigma factor [Candidatus Moranbacteria bacterium]
MQTILTKNPIAQAIEHSLGMLVITDRAGIAMYANEGSERRTGYAIAETIGKKPGRLWGGHMPRAFYDFLWEEIKHVRPVVADIDNQRKNGQSYRERVHIAPLLGDSQDVPFFIAAQPFHIESDGAMERFGLDFKQLFGTGKKISETHFAAWVNRWFATETRVTFDSSAQDKSLVSFIESELIHPMQERFATREEDRILIEAAQADAREFRRLYMKYESLVKRYFLRHLSYDQDMSDDLTQDTFYRALVYLPRFTVTNASYGTYLLRVAHNLLVNHYRKKQTVALFDDKASEDAASCSIPTHLLAERVFDSPVLRASEREMLSMKYREGFSVHEIAVLLGISDNAVKLRLSRARKHLKELL